MRNGWIVTVYDQRNVTHYKGKAISRPKAFQKAMDNSGVRLLGYVTAIEDAFEALYKSSITRRSSRYSVTLPEGFCIAVERL